MGIPPVIEEPLEQAACQLGVGGNPFIPDENHDRRRPARADRERCFT
jgi:hypothetical protein